MDDSLTARAMQDLAEQLTPLFGFVNHSTYASRMNDPTICDFVFGNPQEMPLPGLVDALQRALVPKDKDHFRYAWNEQDAVELVAASLRRRHAIAFEPEDVFLTAGAFGALSVALRALVDRGDEVIFVSPPWFFYEPMITIAGGTAVRVSATPPFDLPVAEIAAAITERTRAIIVNTPQNPTGRIYPAEQFASLADALEAARARIARPIWVISDESYCRILYDGRDAPTPAAVYPHTMLVYTYGKTLLAPGERIGYIALPPTLEGREHVRDIVSLSQIVGGWQFPNGTLQRAVGDLEELSIDVGALQARRDRLARALTGMGYDVIVPEATFYMMVRSPIEDDVAFTEMLAEHDVFVGPGVIFELPGMFRISLTASDDMVERSLPGFAAAIGRVRG